MAWAAVCSGSDTCGEEAGPEPAIVPVRLCAVGREGVPLPDREVRATEEAPAMDPDAAGAEEEADGAAPRPAAAEDAVTDAELEERSGALTVMAGIAALLDPA